MPNKFIALPVLTVPIKVFIMKLRGIMTKEEIAEKLNIEKSTITKTSAWAAKNSADLEKYTTYLLKGKCRAIKDFSPLAKLALVINALPYVYKKYSDKNIDEKIFFDTFSDIAIWCENAREQYGVEGLVNIKWISKHISMKIFRIGRLQYEFSRFAILPHAGIKNILSCPYILGEKCITLHIPQGEKLDNDACKKSLGLADSFFSEHYPDYKYRCYTVITWLLNPELENVLGNESNIVKFGKMFKLLGRVPDSDMNERRVFGYKKDRKNYKPTNALQHYTLDRINKGLPLYSYNGYRDKTNN